MPEMTTQEAVDFAAKQHQVGRSDVAEDICNQVLESFPNFWPAMHLLAIIKHQTGYSAAGVQLLQRALAIEPSLPADCHNNLGEMLRAIGRFEEAADAYNRALELDPALVAVYCNLGELYRQQKQFSLAIQYNQKAIDLQPGNATAWMNVAVALEESGAA